MIRITGIDNDMITEEQTVKEEKHILNKLIRHQLTTTKQTILEAIKQGRNTMGKLEQEDGFSKPLISFHINGNRKLRLGLMELGLINKFVNPDNYLQVHYELTRLGEEIVKGK